MRVTYLTGTTVYLRALLATDKETVAAWFPSPFPKSVAAAEEWLKESYGSWGSGKPTYLIIAQYSDDQPVGSCSLRTHDYRRAFLNFTMAPWLDNADELRAEALRLLIPWLRDDQEFMSVLVSIASDELATIAAAEELGLEQNVRLREYIARPGKRVDGFLYQALNTPWKVADA